MINCRKVMSWSMSRNNNVMNEPPTLRDINAKRFGCDACDLQTSKQLDPQITVACHDQ